MVGFFIPCSIFIPKQQPMRRFDKKKNIEKLNERLNKKGNSLTENSWADDLENDAFPEEFKGMYDDDIAPEDPLGPSPDDLESPVELQHRQEIEDGISRGMGGDYDNERFRQNRFADKRDGREIEPDFDTPYEGDAKGFFGDLDRDKGGLGEETGDDFHKETGLPMGPDGAPPVVDDHYLGDFPESDYDPRTIERMKRKHGLGEGKGKNMNVISEQSLKAFQNLCGVKLIKEEKKDNNK